MSKHTIGMEKLVLDRNWFIRTYYMSRLGRPRVMNFRRTYLGDVDENGMCLNIRPYNIVIVNLYSDSYLNQ